jgi:hypothetical protein
MIRYFDRHAIDTLSTGRLKVSDPSRFNDPYEFLLNVEGSDFPDDVLRRAIKTEKNIRVLCVVDPKRLESDGDILMWSHYADAHSGFRLHIDERCIVSRCEERIEIEYESEIPLLSEFSDYRGDEGARQALHCFRCALGAKGAFWEYEKEIRYFFTKGRWRRDRKGQFDFIPMPAKAVTRVDIGIQTDRNSERRIMSVLSQRRYQHVEVFRAKRVKGKYAIEYVQ